MGTPDSMQYPPNEKLEAIFATRRRIQMDPRTDSPRGYGEVGSAATRAAEKAWDYRQRIDEICARLARAHIRILAVPVGPAPETTVQEVTPSAAVPETEVGALLVS